MTSKEAWLIEWARQWDKENTAILTSGFVIPIRIESICVGVSDQIPVGDKLS